MIIVLYQFNSPVKVNNQTMVGEHYQTYVVEEEQSEQKAVEDHEEIEETEEKTVEKTEVKSKLYLVANWLLSNRLVMYEDAVERWTEGNPGEKILGLGYVFDIDKERYDTVIEMDFVALLINHGYVGFFIYMVPIIGFAVICLKKAIKNIKDLLEMYPLVVYAYAILIGLACAFLAGHVLIAPGVSIYIAICIIKLYGFLVEYSKKLNVKDNYGGHE